MEHLYNLKDRLLKELKGYASKTAWNASDLNIIKETTSAVDHICNIIKNSEEEEGDYSERGSYRSGGSYSREGDMSYRGGSYARGRRGAPRDSRGRYSGDGYSRHGDPAEMIREAMEMAPDEQTRRELERIVEKFDR